MAKQRKSTKQRHAVKQHKEAKLRHVQIHEVTDLFIETVSPTTDPRAMAMVISKKKIADQLDCRLYFIQAMYRGQRLYSYQLIHKDVLTETLGPIKDMLVDKVMNSISGLDTKLKGGIARGSIQINSEDPALR